MNTFTFAVLLAFLSGYSVLAKALYNEDDFYKEWKKETLGKLKGEGAQDPAKEINDPYLMSEVYGSRQNPAQQIINTIRHELDKLAAITSGQGQLQERAPGANRFFHDPSKDTKDKNTEKQTKLNAFVKNFNAQEKAIDNLIKNMENEVEQLGNANEKAIAAVEVGKNKKYAVVKNFNAQEKAIDNIIKNMGNEVEKLGNANEKAIAAVEAGAKLEGVSTRK